MAAQRKELTILPITGKEIRLEWIPDKLPQLRVSGLIIPLWRENHKNDEKKGCL
jgi:1,2-phenylacetyl-CoA epoxidase catalytic subunit